MGCFGDFLLAITLNSRQFTYPNEQGFNHENLLGNFSEELQNVLSHRALTGHHVLG